MEVEEKSEHISETYPETVPTSSPYTLTRVPCDTFGKIILHLQNSKINIHCRFGIHRSFGLILRKRLVLFQK